MFLKRCSSGARMLAIAQSATRSQLPRGSTDGSARRGGPPWQCHAAARTFSARRSRTGSSWGGICTTRPAGAARSASGSRRRERSRGTSRLRLLQDLADPLLEPVEAARLDRLGQSRANDQHVVVSRFGGQMRPGLAQPALDPIADHGAADLLRYGHAEPWSIAVVVLTLEPVQHEVAGRDRATVTVDGVEVPRAGKSMAALHGGSSYADSRFRPLARRRFRMARPARVDMRAR